MTRRPRRACGDHELVPVRRLAVGGTAEVFVARRVDGEEVVVKQALPGAGPAALRCLAREREAQEAAADPHVVRCLVGDEDHLVLELVDGLDLRRLLARLARHGERRPLPAALAVIDGLARGLEAIHWASDAAGQPLALVHRAVNPANVLVSRGREVKVADLGVVQAALASEPTLDGVRGTLF